MKAALENVDDFAVVGDGDGLGGVEGARHVILVDHPARDTHHAAAVDRGNVAAGQADQGGGDLQARRALGFVDRAGDGLGSRCQVDDRAFAYALGRLDAHAQNTQGALPLDSCDQGAHLCRSDINSDTIDLSMASQGSTR